MPQALEQTFRELEAQGRETLGREGMAEAAMDFRRQADLRYVGQSHELTLPLTTEALGPAQLAQLLEQFHRTHDRAYGFSAPEEDVELVSVRLSAIGQIAKPALAPLAKATGEATAKGHRPVYFAESAGFVDCPVYDRYALGAGAVVQGPAIVRGDRFNHRRPSSVPSARGRCRTDGADGGRSALKIQRENSIMIVLF